VHDQAGKQLVGVEGLAAALCRRLVSIEGAVRLERQAFEREGWPQQVAGEAFDPVGVIGPGRDSAVG
jgi:hypothetical protein